MQNGCLDFIPGFVIFVCKKELPVSVFSSCKDWTIMNLLTLRVYVRENVASCFTCSSRLMNEIRKFVTTDASMVRERC